MTGHTKFPSGWDEDRVRKVLKHYEEQTDEEATAEDENAPRIVESSQEVPLTDLLRKAFDAASRLPEEEQDAVAEWLLAELATEEGWEERFAVTQDALSALAREASEEHERGETRGLDPGSL